MRYLLVASSLLLGSVTSAHAQVSVSIGVPGVDIGINVPVYPELVRVPGYPVYYDPRASGNYFFYDGAYWVYQGDNWYTSSWYNGPWQVVGPEYVPLYVLRVPVRYYRRPPPYFRGWRADAPPRWGQHWGHDWERHRGGWDRWDRRSVPRAAPLPVYQRGYSGDRYPRAPEHQHSIRSEQYRYQPREDVTRQHFGHPGNQVNPGNRGNPGNWRGEPQRPPPAPARPPAQEPRHDNGRPNQREPHDNGRRNDRDPHDRGQGHDHDNDGRGHDEGRGHDRR
jgi:hypothetical protein